MSADSLPVAKGSPRLKVSKVSPLLLLTVLTGYDGKQPKQAQAAVLHALGQMQSLNIMLHAYRVNTLIACDHAVKAQQPRKHACLHYRTQDVDRVPLCLRMAAMRWNCLNNPNPRAC